MHLQGRLQEDNLKIEIWAVHQKLELEILFQPH